MTAIVINYNVYWLIISAIFLLAGTLIFGVPLWGLWLEMRREREDTEEARKYFDDLSEKDPKDEDEDSWMVDEFDKRVMP